MIYQYITHIICFVDTIMELVKGNETVKKIEMNVICYFHETIPKLYSK